jgi:hypothetical protein
VPPRTPRIEPDPRSSSSAMQAIEVGPISSSGRGLLLTPSFCAISAGRSPSQPPMSSFLATGLAPGGQPEPAETPGFARPVLKTAYAADPAGFWPRVPRHLARRTGVNPPRWLTGQDSAKPGRE